ncbi:MAG: YfcC family protein [Clostridia bacterium]|nr:YfcC family protein [Clostridia bacterium]
MKKSEKALINLPKKTFIQVVCLLLGLLVLATVLTYVIPSGEFGKQLDEAGNVMLDESGKEKIDYSVYIQDETGSGIPIWKALLSPFLVFASSEGLALIVLSLFLFILSAAFQVMNDVGGIRSLVGAVARKFERRKYLLLALLSFLFYCFGSFLGLFEEMLTMLPVTAALCIVLGFDSFTGFLVSIIACGFGFAGAITNPFTVLLASNIIDVNPLEHIWYRILIFFVMFALFLCFLFLYVKKLEKDPANSLTLEHDAAARGTLTEQDFASDSQKDKKARIVYSAFLLVALALIIVCSSIEGIREGGYTVPILAGYFLLFGIGAGLIASEDTKQVFRSFGKGFVGALPTLAFIALASAARYILEEGRVLHTLAHGINSFVEGKSPIVVALIIYLVVLVLEFFVSSSTAKAFLVMGLLSALNIGLSKPLMVLLYTFGDGYTNVIFPTSPVLLISLSMIGLDYFKWVKKSVWLFLYNFLLVVLFIVLAVVIGY